MYFLLSRTQAGPGRTVKQEEEEINRNHVQTFSGCSVEESSDDDRDIIMHACEYPILCKM